MKIVGFPDFSGAGIAGAKSRTDRRRQSKSDRPKHTTRRTTRRTSRHTTKHSRHSNHSRST